MASPTAKNDETPIAGHAAKRFVEDIGENPIPGFPNVQYKVDGKDVIVDGLTDKQKAVWNIVTHTVENGKLKYHNLLEAFGRDGEMTIDGAPTVRGVGQRMTSTAAEHYHSAEVSALVLGINDPHDEKAMAAANERAEELFAKERPPFKDYSTRLGEAAAKEFVKQMGGNPIPGFPNVHYVADGMDIKIVGLTEGQKNLLATVDLAHNKDYSSLYPNLNQALGGWNYGVGQDGNFVAFGALRGAGSAEIASALAKHQKSAQVTALLFGIADPNDKGAMEAADKRAGELLVGTQPSTVPANPHLETILAGMQFCRQVRDDGNGINLILTGPLPTGTTSADIARDTILTAWENGKLHVKNCGPENANYVHPGNGLPPSGYNKVPDRPSGAAKE